MKVNINVNININVPLMHLNPNRKPINPLTIEKAFNTIR